MDEMIQHNLMLSATLSLLIVSVMVFTNSLAYLFIGSVIFLMVGLMYNYYKYHEVKSE